MSDLIQKNIELKSFTSWLVGGVTEFAAFPKTEAEIFEALKFAQQNRLTVNILGGGSNVLISDRGVSGLTICLKDYSSTRVELKDNQVIIGCTSGTSKSELLKIFLKHKLAPALFLAGIPGDVGGGVVMNAGVSEEMTPREFEEIIHSFEVIKWNQEKIWTEVFLHDQVKWQYRHSLGWQPGIISKVTLAWNHEIQADIVEKVRAANKVRLSKQPLDKPSCGSVFMNPPGMKAAQLIDQCGLKGFQIGDAQVSLKHANFIVNIGNSKADDIWNVITHVQETVKKQKGIDLKTEVIRMGHWT